MHFLVLGQSNVANHGEGRETSEFGRVFHNGSYKRLADPVAGGTGEGGSVWTRFAGRAENAGICDDLTISLCAAGGTSMADWSVGGKCLRELEVSLPTTVTSEVPVSHVIFHQGERDNLLATEKSDYIEQFAGLYESVRRTLPESTWILCRATFRMGVTSDVVRSAQEEIIVNYPNIVAGPDTDQFGEEYRLDGTHFNNKGLDAFAAELVKTFAAR